MTGFREHRFHVLDGMRGLAALLVMLFHFFNQSSYRFLGNAYVAVDFFFVLSGFVICHSYGERICSGMSLREYFARRMGRLFPMMAVGILVGLPVIFLLVGQGRADYTILDIALSTILNFTMPPFLNDNVKMVGHHVAVIGQTFPADDPLWSIFAEMFVSMLFFWLVKFSNATLRWICLVALMGFIVVAAIDASPSSGLLVNSDIGWDTSTFIALFPRVIFGFTCGMLIRRSYSVARFARHLSSRLDAPGAPALLYLVLLAALILPFRVKGFYSLIEIAVIGPFLVVCGSQARIRSNRLLVVSEFLAWISYPVYCLHRPIMNIVAETSVRPAQFVAIVATLTTAILVSRFFDAAKIQLRLTALIWPSQAMA